MQTINRTEVRHTPVLTVEKALEAKQENQALKWKQQQLEIAELVMWGEEPVPHVIWEALSIYN